MAATSMPDEPTSLASTKVKEEKKKGYSWEWAVEAERQCRDVLENLFMTNRGAGRIVEYLLGFLIFVTAALDVGLSHWNQTPGILDNDEFNSLDKIVCTLYLSYWSM